MKFKYLIVFILVPIVLSGQINNWKDKTADELANITTGVTNIGSKEHWVDNFGSQIEDLYDAFAYELFTVNDATPDITDAQYYRTANTSSTAITTFTTTVTAATAVKYIRIGDSNTTFTHSASFDLGGVSLAPQSGDIMVFYYDATGTKWHGKFSFIE